MIGTNIRGIRHLWRVSDYSLRKILARCGEHSFDICEVFKTKPTSQIGERMFIFNPSFNSHEYGYTTICGLSKENGEMLKDIRHSRILEVVNNGGGFRGYEGLFSEITLLPPSFDKDYESFLKENGKMISNLTSKYGIDVNDIRIKRIYIYTEGSKNFFQWAVDLYFKCGCSMRTIQNILNWNCNYKQLTKNLSKGTITAYTNQESIISLMDELSALRNEKRINDSINSFNTAQKKLLKNNELSAIDKNTLARFAKLSETKRVNFIRKVSTINDYQELMRQMRHVTSVHFEWSKESFMDYIKNVEGVNYEVIFENDSVVLVKVRDYETIKQLGKTTNWCISKSKTYWNNYIENYRGKTTQYMVFDFSKLEDDKLSIVGFTTTRNKGITSAHNFVNDDLMNKDCCNNLLLKSYLSTFDESCNIYKILKNCGIDITIIAQYDKPQYEWSYDGLMGYLYECVDKANVDIIKYENNKLVLSVRDENIKYFLGDSYMDNVPSDEYDEQHIIFADFSMSQYDVNKLIFAIIYGNSDEDYCNGIYDETSMRVNINFDSKLVEFGVPYDIIRRTDNIFRKVKNAFIGYNVSIIKDCLKIDKNCLNKVMCDSIDYDTMFSVIHNSIVDYLSFDYLNLIYDNGHTLNDYIDSDSIASLLKTLFDKIKTATRRLYRNNSIMEKPSEERIEAFYNQKLRHRDEAIYIGSYLFIKYIVGHENKKDSNFNAIYSRIISNIYHSNFSGGLIKELLYMFLDRLDMSKTTDASIFLVHSLSKFGDEEMKHTLKELCEKYPWVGKEISKRESREPSYFQSIV